MSVSTEEADVQMWNRMHRPGNAWKWDLWNTAWADYMELLANQQGGRWCTQLRAQNQKIHDRKWFEFHCMLFRMQCTARLLSVIKPSIKKVMKMMLNISLALLKSRDHAEPLKLHSLFHPSSHCKRRCQSDYCKHNKILHRISTDTGHSSNRKI